MLFVFDWDGTLGGHESKLSDKNREALKLIKEKGHDVIVATGRGPLNLIEKMGEDYKLLSRYIIGGNGSLIYDFIDKKMIQNITLDQDSIIKTIDSCKELNKRFGIVLDEKTIFFEHEGYINNYKNADEFYNDRIKFDLNNFLNQKYKVNIIGIEFNDFQEMENMKPILIDKLKGNNVRVIFADQIYAQVIPLNIDKFKAVHKVAKLLKLTNEKIIAFGDSENDIEMLKNADYSIVMGHSENRVKNFANTTIDNSNEIYRYIRENLL